MIMMLMVIMMLVIVIMGHDVVGNDADVENDVVGK